MRALRTALRNRSGRRLPACEALEGRALLVTFLVTTTATYYVKATTLGGGSNTLGSYTSRVDIARGFLAEVESNNSPAAAIPLATYRAVLDVHGCHLRNHGP